MKDFINTVSESTRKLPTWEQRRQEHPDPLDFTKKTASLKFFLYFDFHMSSPTSLWALSQTTDSEGLPQWIPWLTRSADRRVKPEQWTSFVNCKLTFFVCPKIETIEKGLKEVSIRRVFLCTFLQQLVLWFAGSFPFSCSSCSNTADLHCWHSNTGGSQTRGLHHLVQNESIFVLNYNSSTVRLPKKLFSILESKHDMELAHKTLHHNTHQIYFFHHVRHVNHAYCSH